MVGGVIAAVSTKGSSCHIRSERVNYRSLVIVFITALALAAMSRTDWYLAVIGAGGLCGWSLICAGGSTPPTVDEIEIDPYTLEEVERILTTALKRRNGFRRVLALIFGFRQGEALGFQWSDFRIDDEDAGSETIYVRRNRLRPTYSHGCSDPCGKKWPGLCPQRVELLPKTGPVKSKAGERPFPVPVD